MMGNKHSTEGRLLRELRVLRRVALVGIFSFIIITVLSAQYVPGKVYYGRNQYIEYWCGNSPLIISAPHAGSMAPSEIPNRTWGLKDNDQYTYEIVKYIRDSMYARTGKYPHLIINRLKRRKLDPNREVLEATDSDPLATIAYNEYHAFIDSAKARVLSEYGKGLCNDFHGHNHKIQRLEIGYLLMNDDLQLPDTTLNENEYKNRSSVKHLAQTAPYTFAQLIRGETSLGHYFEELGYPAVPSQSQPNAGSDPYFSGGYSVLTHGSIDTGSIDAIQTEANFTGIRDSDEHREAFAGAYTVAFNRYIRVHYFSSPSTSCSPDSVADGINNHMESRTSSNSGN
jgi:N-formylglutamate amidohydrolase